FFQAEDGIRVFHVTGVQTCALPILPQQAIIGMLPHIIPQGVPQAIIDVIMSQQAWSISMVVPSAGFITHIMPSAVMEQSMWHIIGIIVAIGMDGIEAGMLPIGIMFIAVFIGVSVRGCRG